MVLVAGIITGPGPTKTGYYRSGSERPVGAPVAQLDRAPDFESVGRGFESLRARHFPETCKGDWKSDNLVAHLGVETLQSPNPQKGRFLAARSRIVLLLL